MSATQTDGAYRQMGVYEEVLHKIQSDYVTEPNVQKVTTGALHGLLESLDTDSAYLTPSEYALYLAHQHEGVSQVGLNVSKRFGYASVISVVPGSPADHESIHDGDIIESIEGQSTREISVAMLRLMLEGKPGTSVTIGVVRPQRQEPDQITLTRTAVLPPAMDEEQYENSTILYLKPIVLTHERVDAIIARLKEMQKDGNKKVLLDLRDVAGGDDHQAFRLANAFLQSGTIATLQGQTIPEQKFTADPSKYITSAPLVVLVNHGTAGPAELVAGAILDNKRGDLVGDRTFGEGAVQKTINLPDGAALLLTVANYESPSGKKIEDQAIVPNVVVAESIDEILAEEGESTPAEEKAAGHTDDQLNKALDILKQKSA
ncbi:S41 family peptidase [Paracidobacterium acidisoli]|uniref:S41 family peptidase n=1 Tax=Paracidobacterium acidisoli TaxID=2303751 RepID=UPI003314DD79